MRRVLIHPKERKPWSPRFPSLVAEWRSTLTAYRVPFLSPGPRVTLSADAGFRPDFLLLDSGQIAIATSIEAVDAFQQRILRVLAATMYYRGAPYHARGSDVPVCLFLPGGQIWALSRDRATGGWSGDLCRCAGCRGWYAALDCDSYHCQAGGCVYTGNEMLDVHMSSPIARPRALRNNRS